MTNPDPALNPETAVTVGRVVAPHGIRGDIKVLPLTDFPERFRAGSSLWIDGTAYKLERSRFQGRLVFLKLEGVDDRNGAEELRERELKVAEAFELPADDIFYQHDIVGLEVVDLEGASLGHVADIISTGSNDVYVVRGERGEVLLPAIEDVIKEIDVAHGRVQIDLLPGLEFQAASPRPARRTTKRVSPKS